VVADTLFYKIKEKRKSRLPTVLDFREKNVKVTEHTAHEFITVVATIVITITHPGQLEALLVPAHKVVGRAVTTSLTLSTCNTQQYLHSICRSMMKSFSPNAPIQSPDQYPHRVSG